MTLERKNYFKEIRFWILLFFIVRLYAITNPPLDASTLWRQTDVLMISRNFYEIDNNIFYPRIDLSTTPSGSITGVEFPIYNYLIYITSIVFDYEHWYGRLINLVFSCIGIYYFFLLIRKYYSEETAFNATLLLLASAWFAYSRVIFPDIFAASLCIMAIYYVMRFFESAKKIDLALYTILAMIGCLSKISAMSILAVLIIPIIQKKYAINTKLLVLVASAFIIATISLWYFWWVPHLVSLGISYFSMGFPFSMGIHDVLTDPLPFAKKFYDDPLKYTGSVVVLIGIYYAIKNKKASALLAPLIVLAAYFFLFVLKSGKWFHINGYYFVMYVPAIALLAAIGISYVGNRYKLILLTIVILENLINQAHVFIIREPYQFYTRLESTFDNLGSNRNDLIIVGCDECSNAPLYMSHRKGLKISKQYILNKSLMEEYKSKGFKYLLLQKKLHGLDITLPYEVIHEENDFCIYKL